MSPLPNGRVLFNSIPEGFPEPGKTVVYDVSQTIDVQNVLLDGGFLVKTLELSVDPYMRGRMRPPTKKSYADPFILGEPLEGYGVGVVVRSESPLVKPGDHVYGIFKHQNYVIRQDLSGLRIIENPSNIPWSAFVGVLGMPGKTALYGWKEFSRAKKGETAFITTGAGPVGSFVIQLAKQDGLKVIASAGSDEKVKFMKKIGADVAFNYKTANVAEVLEKEGPIDIYWDNVGGETLDAALEAAALYARFIECGMISGYNTSAQPIKNLSQIIGKNISINGFIVFRFEDKYGEEFYSTIPHAVAAGKIKYTEERWNGLEHVGSAILAVQKGNNKGKAVVHIADE